MSLLCISSQNLSNLDEWHAKTIMATMRSKQGNTMARTHCPPSQRRLKSMSFSTQEFANSCKASSAGSEILLESIVDEMSVKWVPNLLGSSQLCHCHDMKNTQSITYLHRPELGRRG
jgi:hypothetical protein